MKWVLVVAGITFGALCEAVFFKVPFVLIVLLLTLVYIQKPWIILLSIPAGMLLDSLTFRLLGESSLFFAIMMGLFFGYGKKFEIQSLGFVVFASCITSLAYLLIFGSEHIVIQTLFSVGFTVVFFILVSFLREKFAPTKSSYSTR